MRNKANAIVKGSVNTIPSLCILGGLRCDFRQGKQGCHYTASIGSDEIKTEKACFKNSQFFTCS
jgi:hypothetical protein